MGQCAVAESALSWSVTDGVIELALHRSPCNELGSVSLEELEKFATALQRMQAEAHALIIYSELKPGFCAGAGLAAGLLKSKFTLGACRAPSSVLK